MTDVLDVVALVCGVVAGFLVTPALGFAVICVGGLSLSWSISRKKRKAAEDELVRAEIVRLARQQ